MLQAVKFSPSFSCPSRQLLWPFRLNLRCLRPHYNPYHQLQQRPGELQHVLPHPPNPGEIQDLER